MHHCFHRVESAPINAQASRSSEFAAISSALCRRCLLIQLADSTLSSDLSKSRDAAADFDKSRLLRPAVRTRLGQSEARTYPSPGDAVDTMHSVPLKRGHLRRSPLSFCMDGRIDWLRDCLPLRPVAPSLNAGSVVRLGLAFSKNLLSPA